LSRLKETLRHNRILWLMPAVPLPHTAAIVANTLFILPPA